MRRRLVVLAIVPPALLGCESRPPPPTPPGLESARAAPAKPPESAAPSVQAALDDLDRRTPVPLLPMMARHQKENMRDHLLAVQEIVAAVASKDFAGVEKSASRIGYSEQMGRMCSHMGAGAAGFTEQALAFHHTADAIGAAARIKDERAVLQALSETLSTCTGCHAAYKQQVVDDATWRAATGGAPPAGPH